MKATSLRILSGFLLLFSGSVAAFIGSILFGSVSIPLEEVFNILLNGESSRVSWKMILWDYRIPKALTAFIGGSALAVSGLLMQTYFRNPLAGPYVLGISSGASLGVAISVMLLVRLNINSSPFQSVSSLFSACLGSLLVTAIILLIARKVNSPTILLLVGLMFGYASAGVVNLLIYLSEAREIQSFMIWSFGSFARVPWEVMPWFCIPTIICLVGTILISKSLNAIQLGKEYATTMGVSTQKIRFIILFIASILAGGVTAFCGPIAFIGIAVPHLSRSLLRTSDNRLLVPTSMMLGGIACLLADLFSQLPGMEETLPLNAITSLIGAPVVIWILLKSKTKFSVRNQ